MMSMEEILNEEHRRYSRGMFNKLGSISHESWNEKLTER
jgi:hypothetical protein